MQHVVGECFVKVIWRGWPLATQVIVVCYTYKTYVVTTAVCQQVIMQVVSTLLVQGCCSKLPALILLAGDGHILCLLIASNNYSAEYYASVLRTNNFGTSFGGMDKHTWRQQHNKQNKAQTWAFIHKNVGPTNPQSIHCHVFSYLLQT